MTASTTSPPGQKATAQCTKTANFLPGTTQQQSVAVPPAVARGQHTRDYLVHIPAALGNQPLLPAIIVFHGHGGTASGAEAETGFSQLGDREHFFAIYPQGLSDDDHLPMWASIGPLDYNIDETVFMNAMLDKLTHDFCIDPQRIYASGFSNGGGMSGFVACQLSTRIAAVAPIAGNYYDLQAGCHPQRPVPILEIHGSNDPVVPYDGISAKVNPQWPLPSVHAWLQTWARRNGCTKGPEEFFHDEQATGLRWTDCRQNATIMHYRIDEGGHSIPATIGKLSTAQVIWNFFQLHSLSSSGS